MTDPIAQLVRMIEEIRRRQRRMMFFAKVTDVDAKKRLIRVTDGLKDDNGQPVKTDWIRWSELSGGLKTKTLPSVGQQVMVMAPDGLIEKAHAVPGHFTDDNPKPDADDDDYVLTNGKVTIAIKDDKITIKTGNSLLEMAGDHVTINGDRIDWNKPS